MPTTEPVNDEAAILGRALGTDAAGLSPAAARAILKIGLPAGDKARMHDLAVKNQAGELTPIEARELESYRRVGRVLDLLAARARRALVPAGGNR